MLTKRLIVCLDVDAGRVVKGTQFVDLKDMGDPVELAARYAEQGADEIVFHDITASSDNRETMFDVVRRTAESVFVPLTVGGGVRSCDDIARVLRAGADKVAVDTAAVINPTLMTEAADRFGRQCVVASIDGKRTESAWEVVVKGGREATGLDAIEWARECVDRGAGEILLTSIDRDGARSGYDLDFLRAVSESVSVPVIASGGAGNAEHIIESLADGVADAALIAGIVHDGTTTVGELKSAMADAGIPTRKVA